MLAGEIHRIVTQMRASNSHLAYNALAIYGELGAQLLNDKFVLDYFPSWVSYW